MFPFCPPWLCVLPGQAAYTVRGRPVASPSSIGFVHCSSNYIALYCMISHSAAICSQLDFFSLAGGRCFSSSQPISLPFPSPPSLFPGVRLRVPSSPVKGGGRTGPNRDRPDLPIWKHRILESSCKGPLKATWSKSPATNRDTTAGPGCPGPHPASPGKPVGTGHQPPHSVTCCSASAASLQKISSLHVT